MTQHGRSRSSIQKEHCFFRFYIFIALFTKRQKGGFHGMKITGSFIFALLALFFVASGLPILMMLILANRMAFIDFETHMLIVLATAIPIFSWIVAVTGYIKDHTIDNFKKGDHDED